MGQPPTAKDKPLIVLELFTSQGCSSCMPADELLKAVKDNYGDEIIVLSYHVDYWSYIGWKDPFSQKNFSQKQRLYGNKFKSRSIYTPQVVINGREHFVGSNQSIMNHKLAHYGKEKAEAEIKLHNLKQNGETWSFQYSINGNIDNKRLRVALLIKHRETVVKRGENSNRILQNANIVVKETYIDLAESFGNSHITIPNIVKPEDELYLIGLIENENFDIVGGTQVNL